MTAAHPLRGPARWLILPGIAALGGGIANSIEGSGGLDAFLIGAVVGGAPALAAAISARAWLAPLVALPLGFGGLAVLHMWIFERSALTAISHLMELDVFTVIFAVLIVLPAPIHAWRLALQLSVGALLAAPLKCVGGTWEWWAPFGIVALGQIAAIETALRMSRKG